MAVAASGRPTKRLGAFWRIAAYFARTIARQSANIISFARLCAVPPVFLLIQMGEMQWALWLFIAAALSDVLDGYLARRIGIASQLGALLDPISDKLVVGAALVAVWSLDVIPQSLILMIFAREAVMIGGSLLWLRRQPGERISPLAIGRLAAVLQCVMIISALAHLAGIPGSAQVLIWVVPATAVAIALSLIVYIYMKGAVIIYPGASRSRQAAGE